jgi:ABC-type transport system involved in cytochrome c biogenesis permease subunit
MLPKTISQQLVPALQSYWLTIHVTLAALGSGAFAVATAVSFIYLLKSGNPGSNPGNKLGSRVVIPGVVSVLVLPWVFYLLGTVTELFPIASELLIIPSQNAIEGTGGIFIAFGMFLPVSFLIWSIWYLRSMRRIGSSVAGAKLVAVTFASFLIGSLIVGLLISGDSIVVSANSPYKIFEFLGMAYFVSIPVFFILWWFITKTGLLERIPMNMDILDDINYKAIALGYPLYTVGALFAGAIWAEQAWGQFWGWDPKEVGSLIIWLFYSGFLHARYHRKWKGNRAAILSLCGFGMILLSFFGNYFFGGQHTYV